MLSIITAFLAKALIPSLTLLTPLVSWGLAEGARGIRNKFKNEAVDSALTRITHTVETTVADLSQTMVKKMKEATDDGRLTPEEARDIKGVAVQTVFDQVPDKIQKLAEGGVNDLTLFVQSKIEQAVSKQKTFLPPLSRIIKMGSGE